MADPSRVRVSGPLEPFAAGFAEELTRHGYRPRPLVLHLRLMADASRWLTEAHLNVSGLAIQAERFLNARRAAGSTRHLTGQALRPRTLSVSAATRNRARNADNVSARRKYAARSRVCSTIDCSSVRSACSR